MKLWFDIDLSYEEIKRLEEVRGKLTQMEYVKQALIEKMESSTSE